LHSCIKKVTEDLDGLRFNTAISALMYLSMRPSLGKQSRIRPARLPCLAPAFAPHLSEELFEKLTAKAAPKIPGLSYQPWPRFDPRCSWKRPLKCRSKSTASSATTSIFPPMPPRRSAVRRAGVRKAQAFLEGKPVKKVIIIPKRLVNIVI